MNAQPQPQPRATTSPGAQPTTTPLVEVEGLRVRLGGPSAPDVLRGVNCQFPEGARSCIVGSSGSGKTLLVRSILGVVPPTPGIIAGHIRLGLPGGPVDLLEGLERAVDPLPEGGFRVDPEWQRVHRRRVSSLWGDVLGYVAQGGPRALDPTQTVEALMAESIRCRERRSIRAARCREMAASWLEVLRLDPGAVFGKYPSELSGGMAQRVAVASVLARGAKVLIADEPSTGLDSDARDRLLAELVRLHETCALRGLILITHDFDVVERVAQHVVVVDSGQVVDQCDKAGLQALDNRHHRTTALMSSARALANHRRAPRSEDPEAGPRLRVRALQHRHGAVGAQSGGDDEGLPKDGGGLSFELRAGEILGLMGPSGVGKTSLAQCIIGLQPPASGQVEIDGVELSELRPRDLRRTRRKAQLLFQQPAASIHPNMTVEQALLETAQRVAEIPKGEQGGAVDAALDAVNLSHRRGAYPRALSGGELRRVGLARVLLTRPRVLIADEPTAAIDASLCLDMLKRIERLSHSPEETAIIVITHDPRVINALADRVLTLHSPRIEGGALQPPIPDTESPTLPEETL